MRSPVHKVMVMYEGWSMKVLEIAESYFKYMQKELEHHRNCPWSNYLQANQNTDMFLPWLQRYIDNDDSLSTIYLLSFSFFDKINNDYPVD